MYWLNKNSVRVDILCCSVEVSRPTGSVPTTQQEDDIVTMEDDYQALTSKEETDLDQLMSECKIAISNAELFAEQLSKQLSVLDGVGIVSIQQLPYCMTWFRAEFSSNLIFISANIFPYMNLQTSKNVHFCMNCLMCQEVIQYWCLECQQ